MTEKRDRLVKAIEYLKYGHVIETVSDLAQRMGVNRSHLSSVMNMKTRKVTDELLLKLNSATGELFNTNWLLRGEGDMLKTESTLVNNALNSIVGQSNTNCSISVGSSGETPPEGFKMANRYNDSPGESGRWAPVVPNGMASMPDFDIIGHLQKQMAGGNVERLYSGTLDIDAWHYVPDDDLEDFCKGDCLGIKAYPQGDERIIPGKLYVIDTKLNGMVVRYLWQMPDGSGYKASTSKDGTRNTFPINRDDVIRIYRKLIMFRY